MRVYEGKLVSQDIKVGIVVARFNEFITSKLLGGAIDGLKRENVKDEDIEVAWVPGAFEIYDYVCSEVSKGVANVSLGADIPVMFGVLTTDTIEQAVERAGTKAGNKGFECAQGAIEMVNLIRELS